MTAMCVALDPATGAANVVGAGHPPLLVARKSGGVEEFPSLAPPLGVVKNSEFAATSLELGEGDAFLIYTDGIYGRDGSAAPRLTQCTLTERVDPAAGSAEGLLTCLLTSADPLERGQPAADDIAAIAVRRCNGA